MKVEKESQEVKHVGGKMGFTPYGEYPIEIFEVNGEQVEVHHNGLVQEKPSEDYVEVIWEGTLDFSGTYKDAQEKYPELKGVFTVKTAKVEKESVRPRDPKPTAPPPPGHNYVYDTESESWILVRAQETKVEEKPKEEVEEEEIPTKLKRPKIAPPYAPKERAVPATKEMEKTYSNLKTVEHNLEVIKNLINEAKTKFAEEKKRIEEEGGKVAHERELTQQIEQLGKLVETTEAKIVHFGDEFAEFREETKVKPFKPTDKWKLEKVLEKSVDAKTILDRAVRGAQSLATKETVRELIVWPKRISKLDRQADLLGRIEDIYEDVKDFLKEILSIEDIVDTLEPVPVMGEREIEKD